MNIGKTYSFEVYPTLLLGTQLTNLKLVADLDAETARRLGFDPQAWHAKVYPTLPEGSVDDYNAYTYHKFKTSDDQEIIIGEPWIKPTSIVEVSTTTLLVTVKATVNDIAAVRSALVSNGFAVQEVKVSS